MSTSIPSTSRLLSISISRYNPETDKKPYMQTFEVNTQDFKGHMLLDAIEAIREKHPDVGLRRSCGEGVCGSDGMNINGTNGLACITPLKTLANKIKLRPLPGFPIIRDLIVDMSQFYAQYERMKPFLQNKSPTPEKERLQSPCDRAKLDGLYECILCACCTSSCPSYWWNPDKFAGPAALLNANRFLSDTRDDATEERLEDLKDPFSVFRCRSIMNCGPVCPKGLNPTKSITHIKQAMISKTSDEKGAS